MREDHEMSLGDHLEELRKCIMRAVYGVVIAACVAGVFWQEVMTTLLQPYLVAWQKVEKAYGPAVTPTGGETAVTPTNGGPAVSDTAAAVTGTEGGPAKKPPHLTPKILAGSPTTPILAIIMVTTIVGVLAASPWVLYQIWSFVGVGLKERERRFIRIYGPVSFLLFAAGGALFYFVVLPQGLAALMAPSLSITLEGIPLLAFIEQPEVIEKILTHLGLFPALSLSKGPAPAHSPPADLLGVTLPAAGRVAA